MVFVATVWAKSSESKPPQLFADKWAVVIGVDEFSNPSWNLQYAAQLDISAQSYLAASDTNAKKLFATAIEMEQLPRVLLERVRAGTIVIIVDADFSGAMARPIRKSLSIAGESLLRPGHSLHVVCSTDSKESSWESKSHRNSVYTGDLLAALILQGERAFQRPQVLLPSK